MNQGTDNIDATTVVQAGHDCCKLQVSAGQNGGMGAHAGQNGGMGAHGANPRPPALTLDMVVLMLRMLALTPRALHQGQQQPQLA